MVVREMKMFWLDLLCRVDEGFELELNRWLNASMQVCLSSNAALNVLPCTDHLSAICLWIHSILFFRMCCLSLSLFHRLSPSQEDAVFIISGFGQRSGDRGLHHVRLANLPHYPEMWGRLQSPVKCQGGGSLNNLSEQTVPQDTAAVF